MNGFNFPKMFKGNSIDVLTGRQSIINQLNLLINSELFEMRFDPGYGSNVPLLKLRPDTPLTRDLIIDAIYDGQIFCPNVQFDRKQVKIKKSRPGILEITITAVMTEKDIIRDVQLFMDVQGES